MSTSCDSRYDKKLVQLVPGSTFSANYGISTELRKIEIPLPISEKKRYLLIENPHINQLELRFKMQKDTFLAGDHFPYFHRLVHDRNIILPLPVLRIPDTALIKLDKRGEHLSFRITMLDEDGLDSYVKKDNWLIGFISGAYLLAFMIALILLFYSKTLKFIYFIFYLFFSLVWLFNDAGILYGWLWPNATEWHNASRGIFSSFSMIFFGLYLYQNADSGMLVGLRRIISIIIVAYLFKFILNTIIGPFSYHVNVKLYTLYINAGVITVLFGWVSWYMIRRIHQFGSRIFEMLAILIYALFLLSQGLRELGLLMPSIPGSHQLDPALFVFMQVVCMGIHLYRMENLRREMERKHFYHVQMYQERKLGGMLLEVEERERKRMARNIHDEIGSIFAAFKYRILFFREKNKDLPLSEDLDQLIRLADTGIRKQYAIIDELTSDLPEDGSLGEALRSQIEMMTIGILKVDFYFSVDESLLTLVEKKQIFRIICELLSNSIKHSNASALSIDIRLSEKLAIYFSDNGRGFNMADTSSGNGITSIKDRIQFLKGQLQLESSGAGTIYHIEIPKSDG